MEGVGKRKEKWEYILIMFYFPIFFKKGQRCFMG